MPRDLFGNVTRPSISIGSRKWYTLPLSLISHSAIVLLLVAIPILAPAVMPSVFADDTLTVIRIEMPKPPPVPRPADPISHPAPEVNPNAAPIDAPDKIGEEKPRLEPGFEKNDPSIAIGTISDGSAIFNEPPPPVVKAPPQPVRPGFQGVRTPVKTRHVDPVYPQIAMQAGIQGIVIIEATIGVDGQVTNARVLRSLPLLDQSALDAVRQWQFTPTMLNGAPVPVVMTVTVNFTLRR